MCRRVALCAEGLPFAIPRLNRIKSLQRSAVKLFSLSDNPFLGGKLFEFDSIYRYSVLVKMFKLVNSNVNANEYFSVYLHNFL